MTHENQIIVKLNGVNFIVSSYTAESAKRTAEELIKALIIEEILDMEDDCA